MVEDYRKNTGKDLRKVAGRGQCPWHKPAYLGIVFSRSFHPEGENHEDASTTLADLFRPPLVANPFSTMRASLRRGSSDEFENSLAHGGQGWVRRRPVDCFFPALLF